MDELLYWIERERCRLLDELVYLRLANNRYVRVVEVAWRMRGMTLEVMIVPEEGEWDEGEWDEGACYVFSNEQREEFLDAYCHRRFRGRPMRWSAQAHCTNAAPGEGG